MADLLAAVPATGGREPAGIIVPHAGYIYSAVTAAHAFARVAGLSDRWQRAVIIGRAHYVRFSGVAAPAVSGFATPLGELPVDAAAIAGLAAEGLIAIDDRPHRTEHAIEIELPFLQLVLGRPPIVTRLCGATSARAVAAAIAAVWRADTLLVVSSDLSHYESYAAACRHDARTAAAIEAGRETAISAADACGHLAIRGALIAAAQRGFTLTRLDLRNSGDTAGDKRSVVGLRRLGLVSGRLTRGRAPCRGCSTRNSSMIRSAIPPFTLTSPLSAARCCSTSAT